MRRKNSKKYIYYFLFILSLLFLPSMTAKAADDATVDAKMNIIGIWLGGEHGDTTLLECEDEYLLIDVGVTESYPYISRVLRERGVENLSVYISHYHIDHDGNINKQGIDTPCAFTMLLDEFEIDNIYVPDIEIYRDIIDNYDTLVKDSPTLPDVPKIYSLLEQYAAEEGCDLIPLQDGSVFRIGKVLAEVIGPVSVSYGQTVNDRSLVTQFSRQGFYYLNAGDAGKVLEAQLVEAYGEGLDADILKLNHHAYDFNNTAAFLEAAAPEYIYACLKDTKDARYRAVKRASAYGITFITGWEKKNICYSVDGGVIKTYISATPLFDTPKTGWVKLYGSGGDISPYDYYYIDRTTFEPRVGFQEIGGHYYYLNNAGMRMKGNYDANGVYQPWTAAKRYIYEDPEGDGTYPYQAAAGFDEIDGAMYYFSPTNGIRVKGSQKIDGRYYYFGTDGIMQTRVFYTNSAGVKRYYGIDGYAVRNRMFAYDGDWYIADSDSSIMLGDGIHEETLVEFGDELYAVNDSGQVWMPEEETTLIRGGKTYSVSTDGLLTLQKPGQPEIRAVRTNKKQKAIVRWAEASEASGYVIYVSNKKNGNYFRYAVVGKDKRTQLIKALKKKKTYYVKVRAYSTAHGQTVYGAYSEVFQFKAR